MEITGTLIAIAIATFIAGAVITWVAVSLVSKSKYKRIINDAEKDAEVIRKNKLLEVKEQALQLKSEFEKEVNIRNSRLQSAEAKNKQREQGLNQRQEELQRRRNEVEAIKEN
jgi:ribonuclease Y